jgi:hypothetical protein
VRVSKQVFFRYELGCCEAFRVVLRSWEKLGWKVRLILPGDKLPKGGLVVSPWLVNYEVRPGEWGRKKARKRRWDALGWKTAPLVQYPRNFDDCAILSSRVI